MIKPYHMLAGNIDFVKESSPFLLWSPHEDCDCGEDCRGPDSEEEYVERTYMDEQGDRAVVLVPVYPQEPPRYPKEEVN